AVVASARLHRSPLGLVVHVHEPEAERVAVAPLEVVEQRPREVAAHIRAAGHLSAQREQVLAIAAHAQRVVEAGPRYAVRMRDASSSRRAGQASPKIARNAAG